MCSFTWASEEGTGSTTAEVVGFIATVRITEGAEKLANLATCTTALGAAVPTAVGVVYKVVVVPAAALVIGAGFV